MKAALGSKPISREFLVLDGMRFERWTILRLYDIGLKPSGGKYRRWLCQCDCGVEMPVREEGLRYGRSTGCKRCVKITHGESSPLNGNLTPEYEAWCRMLRRCYTPTNPSYANYGGRGITVCDRWRHNYSAFLTDMGRRHSDRHSLERINNNMGYFPENCCWALSREQVNNRRNTYMINGFPLASIPRKTNIRTHTLYSRVRTGWNLEDALTRPVRISPDRIRKIINNQNCYIIGALAMT